MPVDGDTGERPVSPAPFSCASGAEHRNDVSAWNTGAPAIVIGRPPGSPGAIVSLPGESSPGQYAIGAMLPAWARMARFIAEVAGRVPWLNRRSNPAPDTGVHTSVPVTSHCCGSDAISPWNR